MKFEFSNRMRNVQASAVREILKAASDPKVISFGGGNPAMQAFPVDSIKTISNELFEEDPISMLQYGITEGYGPLRESAKAFFNRHEQVSKEYDDLIITSGSQQIMDFLAKCICNEGDTIICEDPSFLGALNAFRSNGAKLIGVSLEEDGINMEELEKAMQQKPTPKFLYVIPNFQNPMGTTMSLEKRKKTYELAKKYGVLILEDNPYGDLRFSSEAVPSIKSMDEEGIVLYAASLSKIIAPGMRVAVAIGHKDLLSRLTVAKQVADVHTNVWAQRVMDRFLRTTDMDQHLERLQAIYRDQAQLMLDRIKEYFHPSVQYTKPEGGMFIWATFPDDVDVLEFIQEAIKQNVAVVPGSAFMVDESAPCHSIRLNFSTPTKENIEKGIKILGDLTYKFCR